MTASSKYEVNSSGTGGNTSLASTSTGGTVSSTTGITQCSQTSATATTLELNPMGVPTMLQPNSPSSSSSTSKNNGDVTFEPTVDMMVNDFDDEQTLEEEEALAAQEAEDPSAELSSLQKESDMPIEELLALYNCSGTDMAGSMYSPPVASAYKRGSNASINGNHRSTNKITHNTAPSEVKIVKKQTITSLKENGSVEDLEVDDNDEDDDDIKETSKLRELYPETYGPADKRLLRTISRQQSDDDEEGEYSPDEDEFKKVQLIPADARFNLQYLAFQTIMVGSEFQAVIPEGFFKYDDVLPYENEDKLLWDPSRISEQETEEYLLKALKAKQQNGTSNLFAGVDCIPVGNHLRDDEQALYLLLQCGHNTEEALRRKRINAIPSSEQMTSWSEDECRNFESGIRIYGKDFHTIQQSKVRTRSVGELVQFYYLWKKTERHDIFANKARLEKKKYNLHPGLTDYMDRFLEEQEGGSNGSLVTSNITHGNHAQRDRSSSPGTHSSHTNASIPTCSSSSSITCLIQADNKRCTGSYIKHSTFSASALQSFESFNESTLRDPLAIDDEETAINDQKDSTRVKSNSLKTNSLPTGMISATAVNTTSDLSVPRTSNQ